MMHYYMAVVVPMCLAGTAAAATSTADFRAQVEAFAGRPVMVDPRIEVPDCGGSLALAWRGDDRRSVVASCPQSAWRLAIPVGGAAPAMAAIPARVAPIVRRGEPVTVLAEGPGFTIRLDAVAEGDGRPGGRLLVRNLRSGVRVPVEVGMDGMLRVARSVAAATEMR
jgi:flagella basal body P-ring formation protein FlgA